MTTGLLRALLIVGIIGLSNTNPGLAFAEDEVADQFKCAACHTDRLREYRSRRGTPLVPHEPRPVVETGQQHESSTPAMCFSCHDGFVLDSRSLWKNGHMGHMVGMRPSSKIAQQSVGNEPVFPVNDSGRMYCGSCHSAHQIAGAAHEGPSFVRVSPEDGQLCQACHDDKRSIDGSDHQSRAARRRRPPADFESGGVCARCHVAHEARGPVMWAREPGPGNIAADQLCASCHEGDVEPSHHPARVVAWSQSLRDSAGRNSESFLPVFDQAAVQAQNGRIGCPTCHDAHRQRATGLTAETDGKFLRLANSRDFMCADCHGNESLQRYLYFHTNKRSP